MLKLFIGTLISLLLFVAGIVIFYWRDIQYDPTGADLLNYLLLFPLILCVILWSPVFIYHAIKAHQKRKEQQKQAQVEQHLDDDNQQVEAVEIQWLNLNIYSSSAYSAFGENDEILDEIKKFKSPELDTQLQNAYGLPMLSYRIHTLDHVITNQDDDEAVDHPRHMRIQALIEHQLEQHAETLWQISQHLKQSALFYDSELAYEYRMHPAWIDPTSEYDNNEPEEQSDVQQVVKLNRINIHMLLPESMLHAWNEEQSSGVVQDYLSSLGVITQQIHLEHHYFSQETAYKDWMLLLEQISQQSEEITFILNVDSEIDQELLDEKTWLTDHYLPAEYASSWCLASSSLPLLDIKPLKQLKIALNEANLANQFASPAMKQLEQFKDIQPFVLMLDDITDIQTMKKLNQIFDRSGIESHHFIHTKQSFGHTQHLAKVFGFMLSMHLPDELMAMIYSTDQMSTHCFLHACEDSNIPVEPTI